MIGIVNRAIAIVALALAGCATSAPPADTVRITIIGTSDVHGVMAVAPGRGGLTTLSGYANAARAARAADGGAVLLIDAGDMWQGTLESNLTEGASLVEAYNAMGYTAAALGNHEFDFGPAGPAATPAEAGDDPLGALKERTAEMTFPLLSVNLFVAESGERLEWDNLAPSTIVEAAGLQVGIIGVVTERALVTTIAANVTDLAVTPIAGAVRTEADRLRSAGADIVIVTAHAGTRCTRFDDPYDLSSCAMHAEIMQAAMALPQAHVDLIIAGHTHQAVAHVVNGIPITAGLARTAQFSRVDLVVDRATGRIAERKIFVPRAPCPYTETSNGECAWAEAASTTPAEYEGRPVTPDPAVVAVVERAVAHAAERKNRPLGPTLESPFTLEGNPESILGNLFTNVTLERVDADVAIHNVSGGIRGALPAGPITFGDVYEVFPFDNRAVVIELSGAELRQVIAAQAIKTRRRAGFSGMRVEVACSENRMRVDMVLDSGRTIADTDRVRVATNDFLAQGGDSIFSPVMPADGFDYSLDLPLIRDLLVDWFGDQPNSLSAADFQTLDSPRWTLSTEISPSCTLGR